MATTSGSATTSPCVKTRTRLTKTKNTPVHEPEMVSKSNGAEKVSDVAAITSKLDVIMERLQKLEVLDQLVVQVASLTKSLEYCHATIADLKTENNQLKTKMASMLSDTDERRRQAKADHDAVIDLQWRSMRDNLVFYAIPETPDENCDTTLRKFFVKELGVTEDIELARAHRMGKHESGKTRPIVAKFHRYQQRETIRSAGRRLAGKRFGVSEQIPKEWQEKRKPLLPLYKNAKKQGKRARFVGDKLLVEGHFVTVDSPHHQA